MFKNKKMKIAQIAPLWFPVPPKKYGGVERIVAQLCDGLVEKGHDVTLFSGVSEAPDGQLVKIITAMHAGAFALEGFALCFDYVGSLCSKRYHNATKHFS